MDSEQLVRKYKRLFLLFPDGLRTRDIISGFQKFAKKKIIPTEVRSSINVAEIQKGDAFIVIDDNNLVDIILAARAKDWQLGKDIGVISYNETTLKSVIGNGITTITTDFVAMGKTMAEMVVSGKREVMENPFVMIDRKSF
jgi:DNA-binding LacI/PurR family transcriptional regulator